MFYRCGRPATYSIATSGTEDTFHVEAELWYQPIGYRWAINLKPYNKAAEPHRFTAYFDSMAAGAGVMLTRAEAAH